MDTALVSKARKIVDALIQWEDGSTMSIFYSKLQYVRLIKMSHLSPDLKEKLFKMVEAEIKRVGALPYAQARKCLAFSPGPCRFYLQVPVDLPPCGEAS